VIGLDHGGDADRRFQRELAGQTTGDLLGYLGVHGQQIGDLDTAGIAIGEPAHHGTNLLEHAADIGSGLSFDIGDAAHGAADPHDLLGATVHIDFGVAAFALEDQGAGRDPALGDITFGGLDDHCRSVSDQGAGHRYHRCRLVGGQAEQGGDAVRVGQCFDDASGCGHLDGGEHPDGDLVDQADLVHDRDLVRQAVVHQDTVVGLQDRAGDRDSGRGGVDAGRHVAEGVGLVGHHDDGQVRIDGVELVDPDRGPNPDTQSPWGTGVVTDHGGFGDDRLGDGLHGHVADDRRRLIDPDEIKVFQPAVRLVQREAQ